MAAVVLGLIGAAMLFRGGYPSQPHIARLFVTDVIFSDQDRTKMIREIARAMRPRP